VGTVVTRALSNRTLSCLGAVACITALSSAGATIPREPDVCSAWAALPDTKPFLEDVPREGYVFLPFELERGTNIIDYAETVALTAEVRDADGTTWPGYLAYAGFAIAEYANGPPLLWTSSRAFTPGGHYQLLVSVQNPANCAVPGDPIQATYEVSVSDKTLTERLNDAVQGASARLEWTRAEFAPQCCVARSTERCTDPAHCFACTKSAVYENVVLSRTATPVSAYLTHNAIVRGADDVPVATYPFSAAQAEVRLPVPMCVPTYCAELTVTSPLTEETLVSEPTCIPGSEPQIDAAPDGAEVVAGDPCATGSGPGSFRASEPPGCKWYPDVRWFSSAVDGYVALGLTPSDAEAQARASGTGAYGGGGSTITGGTGGAPAAMGTMGGTAGTVWSTSTDHPNCAVTMPPSGRRDGLALGLLVGLLAARRRARRFRRA
jgi:hypothetical protein